MNFEILADPTVQYAFYAVSLGVISFIVGFLARIYIEQKIEGRAEDDARRIIEEARREAENTKKEAIWAGKEEAEKKRKEVEEKLGAEQEELALKEEELQEKEEALEQRLEEVYDEISDLKQRRDRLEKREEQIEHRLREAERELERVSGLTAAQAREQLRQALIDEAREKTAQHIRKIESEAREEAGARSRRIVARALQRCAVEQTTESTVRKVELPSDDMKGRIIGREGRNIRSFEDLTGVDLIVDDTPEAVSVSCFNPMRRELASVTLEKLILDGRIQPARIEEVYEKTKEELEDRVRAAGEEALSELGVPAVPPALVSRIGQLKFIIEGGQNQLEYSKQVANIASLLAAEMGADVDMARRCGILHAIGKTVTDNPEQPYALAGAELAERHNEPSAVIYALASHNEDKPFKTVEGIVLHVATKISRERPGARKKKFGSFINRLEKLEELACDFEGVEEAFAIQAGHEIRVVVREDEIDDNKAELLARDIANRIQEEIDYPDKIKVSLVREKRIIDFAR
ncbi:MAG: ribonuclease Y [bacterium]